jgi:hypothetical protein
MKIHIISTIFRGSVELESAAHEQKVNKYLEEIKFKPISVEHIAMPGDARNYPKLLTIIRHSYNG